MTKSRLRSIGRFLSSIVSFLHTLFFGVNEDVEDVMQVYGMHFILGIILVVADVMDDEKLNFFQSIWGIIGMIFLISWAIRLLYWGVPKLEQRISRRLSSAYDNLEEGNEKEMVKNEASILRRLQETDMEVIDDDPTIKRKRKSKQE